MWKMFDDMIECDECGGILGPPPKFTIPPPPRPPFMADYKSLTTNCNEEELAIKAQQSWDRDMCEAMPILDASLYSSPSLQTSAIIAVFTLLLVLVVLISSLFVWKNKRKVQNFLPCKTPTRGPHHVNGGLPIGGNHTLTYEDPDVHLGHHRPLVMRHHHNVEMLHGKSIHYPSGYPMTRSPPFLVSTSPGPDPYRSNDNVYEELGPTRGDTDAESEPPMQSDDDFAEDELSLPGERFFQKPNDGTAPTTTGSVPTTTIYHERPTTAEQQQMQANAANVVNGHERNSVLSVSSTSTQEASTATAASMCSSLHNNQQTQQNVAATAAARNPSCSANAAATPVGMMRHTNGRNKFHTTNGGRTRQKNAERRANVGGGGVNGVNGDELNTSSSTADANEIGPLHQMYDNQSNLMSLAYLPQHQHHQHQHHNQQHQYPQRQQQQQTPTAVGNRVAYHHSLHQFHHNNNNNNNNNSNNNSNSANRPPTIQFYNTLENEVDRRNRINAQLNNAPAVATIFRERINYPGSGRYQHPPQPYYATNCSNGLLANSLRSRTASRSMDIRGGRRRGGGGATVVQTAANTLEPTYGYAEPVYHDNYHYEAYPTPAAIAERLGHNTLGGSSGSSGAAYSNAYATADFRHQLPHGSQHSQQHPHTQQHPQQLTCPNASAHLYNRGDSSFGSDSGYSHHTPASSIGRHDYDFVVPPPQHVTEEAAVTTLNQQPPPPPPPLPQPAKESATSKLTAALGFSWHRRKGATSTTKAQTAAASLGLMSANPQQQQKQQHQHHHHLTLATKEATSPNNNSASSTTVTSNLENTSSASSTTTSACSSTTSNQNNNATTAATAQA